METQYISLNMTPTGVNPCFHISQYDVGRMLGFIVHSGGATVDLDTYTCTIEATRSDGTTITSAVATTDNIGTFEVTPTMSNKTDKYRCQLVIVDANSKRIASLPFDMDVCKAAMDENSESIEEDAGLYQQYTKAVQGAIAEANADIQAEENARIAAVNTEATARQNADATLQNNIDAEASTRASADSNLQSQINQIVAPSGEAPSAAEVQNARIGSDGTVYPTLGDAIRTQNSLLKSAFNNLEKVESITFIGTNEAIKTNSSPISLTPISRSDFKYAIVSCSENDIFVVSGIGDDKALLWTFCDSDGAVVSRYNPSNDDYAAYSDCFVLIAPSGASKLIVNDKSGSASFIAKKYNAHYPSANLLPLTENLIFPSNESREHAFHKDFSTVESVTEVFDYETIGTTASAQINSYGIQSNTSTSKLPVFFIKDGSDWHYTFDFTDLPSNASVYIVSEFLNIANYSLIQLHKTSTSLTYREITCKSNIKTTPTETVLIPYTDYSVVTVRKVGDYISFFAKNTLLKIHKVVGLSFITNKHGFAVAVGGTMQFVPKDTVEWLYVPTNKAAFQYYVESDAIDKIPRSVLLTQKQSDNPNALIYSESPDGLGAGCILMDCDYQYQPSDGSRYRCEFFTRVALFPENYYGIHTKNKFHCEYYFPSEDNIEDSCHDIIAQVHDTNDYGYALKPMICIFISNGKLFSRIDYSELAGGTDPYITQTKQYELGNAIYDEWFSIDLEFGLGYKLIYEPYTIIKINGKKIFESYLPNNYNLGTASYVKWGLYEESWIKGVGIATKRSCYIRNFSIEG